jgi:hypothetical protein
MGDLEAFDADVIERAHGGDVQRRRQGNTQRHPPLKRRS